MGLPCCNPVRVDVLVGEHRHRLNGYEAMSCDRTWPRRIGFLRCLCSRGPAPWRRPAPRPACCSVTRHAVGSWRLLLANNCHVPDLPTRLPQGQRRGGRGGQDRWAPLGSQCSSGLLACIPSAAARLPGEAAPSCLAGCHFAEGEGGRHVLDHALSLPVMPSAAVGSVPPRPGGAPCREAALAKSSSVHLQRTAGALSRRAAAPASRQRAAQSSAALAGVRFVRSCSMTMHAFVIPGCVDV